MQLISNNAQSLVTYFSGLNNDVQRLNKTLSFSSIFTNNKILVKDESGFFEVIDNTGFNFVKNLFSLLTFSLGKVNRQHIYCAYENFKQQEDNPICGKANGIALKILRG